MPDARRLIASLSFLLGVPNLAVATEVVHIQNESFIATDRTLTGSNFGRIGQDLIGVPPLDTISGSTNFGSTILLSSSNGGKRLVVGAPDHDYSTPNVDAASINIGGGAIHVYEYDDNNGTWSQLQNFFFVGVPGEHLGGQSFSMNGNGTRIAIRRLVSESDWVEVYDMDGNGPPVQIGSRMTCHGRTAVLGDKVTLSPDGTRLAMSCRKGNGNVGQIRMFRLAKVNGNYVWRPQATLNGRARNIFFGFTSAFSNDGKRLVVSSPNYGTGTVTKHGLVEVYALNETNNRWEKIGNDIVGSKIDQKLGWSLDFSGSGSSVVAASPSSDDRNGVPNVGCVQVFSLYLNNWSQVGDIIEGAEENDRFGRSVTVSDDGTRVAASSYTHGSTRGHVRIFDFDILSDSWIQHGTDIDGENPGDRFGFGRFSVSLSGDGNRLASGSEFFTDPALGVSVGRVRVFETTTTQNSSPSYATVMGASTSAAVVTAGPSFIVSPTSHPSPTRPPVTSTREPSTSTPTQVPKTLPPSQSPVATNRPTPLPIETKAPIIPPTDVVTLSPSLLVKTKPPTVSPTDTVTPAPSSPIETKPPTISPTAMVTPAPSSPIETKQPTVLTTSTVSQGSSTSTTSSHQTSYPSQAKPSVTSPTAGPSTYEPPKAEGSKYPTVSFPPDASTLNTVSNVTKLNKFDWDLKRTGPITVFFNDDSLGEEVTLFYDIHRRKSLVRAFQKDCEKILPSTLVGIHATSIPNSNSTDRDTLKVVLDLKEDTIMGSPIFTPVDIERGIIDICVRVDLVMDDANSTSVVFQEEKLRITISMTKQFSIAIIDVDQDEAGYASAVVSTDYNVTACQCNASYVCIHETLTQGSMASICVRANTQSVEISDIRELRLSQDGGISRKVIDDGVEDQLTEVVMNPNGDRQLAVILTQMISEFFEDENPKNVIAEGSCALTFVNNTGSTARKLLRIQSMGRHRVLGEGKEEAGFDMQLELEWAGPESSAHPSHWTSAIFMLAILIGTTMVLI